MCIFVIITDLIFFSDFSSTCNLFIFFYIISVLFFLQAGKTLVVEGKCQGVFTNRGYK